MKPKYSVPTTTATGTRTTTLSQFLDLRSAGKKQHNSPDSCDKNRPTINVPCKCCCTHVLVHGPKVLISRRIADNAFPRKSTLRNFCKGLRRRWRAAKKTFTVRWEPSHLIPIHPYMGDGNGIQAHVWSNRDWYFLAYSPPHKFKNCN